MTADAGKRLGVVVIGRDEGMNLARCLESVAPLKLRTVYVDSGSTDGSPELAESLCDRVISLDASTPFSAARARNEGFEALAALLPEMEYVQFLDGDCELLPGWTGKAMEAFARRGELAVVIGRLVERHPERSVYNRLCDLEWRSPAGDLGYRGSLGGIMMVRSRVFRGLKGFNARVVAGEDSEFGIRAALGGFAVAKIDEPMATHDANILRFSQWWKRSVRAGHAIGQRASLNGASDARDCVHEKRSTWVWGILLPAAIAASAVLDARLALLFAACYVPLFFRIFAFRRKIGDAGGEAGLYAAFTVLAKIANGWGLLLFHFRNRSGRFRIIEYKRGRECRKSERG